MSKSQETTTAYDAAMPQEIAGAINLMAHPFAGAAAMGALGVGLAGQAMGMWLGAMAGAAEVSQRLMQGLSDEVAPAPRPAAKPAPLKLVVSRPAQDRKPATIAKAKAPARKVAQTAKALAGKPAPMEKPAQPDDLKAIGGIGPKLEKVLNELGIWTYGQVAALQPAELAWLDDHLGFAGRIGRDDWVGQAKALSADA
ncbi:NADH-ubiquinone dehydrogenase [Neoaquamicrobium sediminum]|uniref:NADH-ubiquinone dehydrogenase n=1 Tax=Neoaquamicrobium sediminum TaxID=1849104 RepID=UPI00156736F6|nr:NADH-ubiquinone dehydrogenase [Mesorhizobium sediminum]NRC54959.1 NADH-ubiquinone dehydrogenase [Mesorhizobium sediminum]